jgi:PPOX class probable FMN-dependent enzyme
MRRFISLSPFLCLGTSGSSGGDVTPRGDSPGFVHVLDDQTLLIPDWPGNNRLDSLTNVVANPHVGLLFFVPGVNETLRINGIADVTMEPALLEQWTVNGKHPRSALRVAVREAYLHCAKALMRSKLYQLTTKGTTTANDNLLARHVLRRHAAEVIQSGIVSVTGIADSASARSDFLGKFGYPMNREAITERTNAINTIQPLTLLNTTTSVPGKVTNTTSIIALLAPKVDGGMMTLDAAITEIFRRALSRATTR